MKAIAEILTVAGFLLIGIALYMTLERLQAVDKAQDSVSIERWEEQGEINQNVLEIIKEQTKIIEAMTKESNK